MKKIIAIVLCLALALGLCSTALAAEIKVTSSPAELTGAGAVTLTFSVTNTSESDMTNFDITGYGGANGWPELNNAVVRPNGALEFRLRDVQIAEDMLGQALNYTISWTENGEAKSQPVSVTVGGVPTETTELAATRKASKTFGAKDEKITLTYTLKNPSSTVSITDITLKDPIAGNDALQSGLTLAPGETKEITHPYTIGSADAISTPAFTYQVNGQAQSLSLEPLTIAVANISLETTVSIGENTPEGILFSIVLKNTGNQSIGKVQVKDELGNKVNEDSFTLEAGKERTLSYTIVTGELRNVYFTITGTDALGQPYENKTKSYEAWPYVDSSLVSLSLVTTVLEQLSQGGQMKVRFVIQNNSSVNLTNAAISEEQLGVLQSQDTLPLGETQMDQDLQLDGPRELVFKLTALDPSGAEHSYEARVTADYVAITTPEPTQTEAIEEDKPSAGEGISGTLLTVLIVLASLMAVAGIALLVLSIYEKKNNARAEEYDEIDPSAPIRFASQEGQQHVQPRASVREDATPSSAAPYSSVQSHTMRAPKTASPQPTEQNTSAHAVSPEQPRRDVRPQPQQQPARPVAERKAPSAPITQPTYTPSHPAYPDRAQHPNADAQHRPTSAPDAIRPYTAPGAPPQYPPDTMQPGLRRPEPMREPTPAAPPSKPQPMQRAAWQEKENEPQAHFGGRNQIRRVRTGDQNDPK